MIGTILAVAAALFAAFAGAAAAGTAAAASLRLPPAPSPAPSGGPAPKPAPGRPSVAPGEPSPSAPARKPLPLPASIAQVPGLGAAIEAAIDRRDANALLEMAKTAQAAGFPELAAALRAKAAEFALKPTPAPAPLDGPGPIGGSTTTPLWLHTDLLESDRPKVRAAVLAKDARALIALAAQYENAGWMDLGKLLRTKAAEFGTYSVPEPPRNLPSKPPYTAPTSDLPVTLPKTDEAPGRAKALELTAHLKSIGGLAGRYKEDRALVRAAQEAMVQTVDGQYGRKSALAIAHRGIVPVVPFYWPKEGTAAAKADFTAKIKALANADPQRATEWAKLLADTQRS